MGNNWNSNKIVVGPVHERNQTLSFGKTLEEETIHAF